MTTKLTLSLDSKVIERAKKYSQRKGTSISKMVEEYLTRLTTSESKGKKRSIMELRGMLGSVPDDFDYKDVIAKRLQKNI